MNSELPNSPEDRLLDELLREQAHGPDEAFLQQIEKAVDAGPPVANKLPAPRNYGRLAIAAGITLATGGFLWSSLHNRQSQPSTAVANAEDSKAKAARELQALNKAIRNQEDKVEERRKVLATIAAKSAGGEVVDVSLSLIGKLKYVKDESRAWVLRPGYGATGRFPFVYEDSSRQTNKTGAANMVSPGDSLFLSGPMANRFKLLGSTIRREVNPRTQAEYDVTIVRVEDQRPNKKGIVYEFPSPLNEQRKSEFVQYDRTAVFSLEANGMEAQEFQVEEDTVFSLPPGGEKKNYLLKSITPAGVVVEMVDGGQMVEINKGSMPAGEALAALAANSPASVRGDGRDLAIKRGFDAQDFVDAKRDFENDQQALQSMKQKLAALKGERTEIASDAMSKKQLAAMPHQATSKRVYAEGATASLAIPEQADNFGDMTTPSSLASGGMSGGLGGSGSGKGSGSGAGLGAGAKDESSALNDLALSLVTPRPRVVPPPASVPTDGSAMQAAAGVNGSVAGIGRGEGSGKLFGLIPNSQAPAKASAVDSRASVGGFVRPGETAPEASSGDRYGAFIDQPWKTPDRDPLSTFSIDVDTASYANVRRMIREGREIPKDAVRIEEFINAFKYHYEAPKGDGPFAVGASLAVCPWAPDHQLVRVSIKGREIEPGKRPASNLVFLIDVSGSMQSPDKLPLLKQSMQTMVSQLDERDRVAIVVYAGSEGVALPSTRLDEEGRAKVVNALAKLEAGGSTNGGAGIKRAYELAMEQKIQGGVNRVILATDGDFNVGVTGKDSLVELVKDRAKSGVYLTVAGFGSGNLNDAMMDAITHDGNGNYFYIDSEREGRKVFLQNLAGTLVTIAKDVKIQVEFNPAKVGSYRLIGYANRVLKNEDFNNDKVDAGDIGAGHTVTAFYELTPVGAATGTDGLKYQAQAEKPAATDEWLTVKLRHKHPEGDESSKIEFPLTGDPAPLDKADSDFQFATAAALLGMKLRGMDEATGMSWEQLIALAKPGLANDATEDRAEFVELIKKLAGHESPKPAPAEVVPVDRSR